MASPALNKLFLELLVSKNKLSLLRSYYVGIKDDIVSILKTVSYQTAMESIVRVDQFTGLYSAEYLYGQAKATIDSEATSIVAMFSRR